MAKGKGEIKGWITRNGVHIPIYGHYSVRGGEEPKAKGAKFGKAKKKRPRSLKEARELREAEARKNGEVHVEETFDGDTTSYHVYKGDEKISSHWDRESAMKAAEENGYKPKLKMNDDNNKSSATKNYYENAQKILHGKNSEENMAKVDKLRESGMSYEDALERVASEMGPTTKKKSPMQEAYESKQAETGKTIEVNGRKINVRPGENNSQAIYRTAMEDQGKPVDKEFYDSQRADYNPDTQTSKGVTDMSPREYAKSQGKSFGEMNEEVANDERASKHLDRMMKDGMSMQEAAKMAHIQKTADDAKRYGYSEQESSTKELNSKQQGYIDHLHKEGRIDDASYESYKEVDDKAGYIDYLHRNGRLSDGDMAGIKEFGEQESPKVAANGAPRVSDEDAGHNKEVEWNGGRYQTQQVRDWDNDKNQDYVAGHLYVPIDPKNGEKQFFVANEDGSVHSSGSDYLAKKNALPNPWREKANSQESSKTYTDAEKQDIYDRYAKHEKTAGNPGPMYSPKAYDDSTYDLWNTYLNKEQKSSTPDFSKMSYSEAGKYVADHKKDFGLKDSDDAYLAAYQMKKGEWKGANTVQENRKWADDMNKKTMVDSPDSPESSKSNNNSYINDNYKEGQRYNITGFNGRKTPIKGTYVGSERRTGEDPYNMGDWHYFESDDGKTKYGIMDSDIKKGISFKPTREQKTPKSTPERKRYKSDGVMQAFKSAKEMTGRSDLTLHQLAQDGLEDHYSFRDKDGNEIGRFSNPHTSKKGYMTLNTSATGDKSKPISKQDSLSASMNERSRIRGELRAKDKAMKAAMPTTVSGLRSAYAEATGSEKSKIAAELRRKGYSYVGGKWVKGK